MKTLSEFKAGELKRLREGVLPLELTSVDDGNPEVEVVGMEHRYGYNRFVLVELKDGSGTRVIVRPDDFA